MTTVAFSPDVPSTMPAKHPSVEEIQKVEACWKERAKTQGLNPKHKGYGKAEVEFFCGAMTAFQTVYPGYNGNPKWVLCIMSGRNIVSWK